MYPYEVADYLRKRNWYIGGDDLLKVISVKENPQINHIEFNPSTSKYNMWDVEGNFYEFTAMPYKEAVEKGLVKQKDDDYER